MPVSFLARQSLEHTPVVEQDDGDFQSKLLLVPGAENGQAIWVA